MIVTIDSLRAEHRVDAFGIGVAAPRLSWIVTADDPNFRQRIVRSRRRDSRQAGW